MREKIRIEDKKIPLPEVLIEAIRSSLPLIGWGSIQLVDLLKGKKLGLARSAGLRTEKMPEEDDSRSVSNAAFTGAGIRCPEEVAKQKEDEKRKRRDEERSRIYCMKKAVAKDW